MTKTVITKVERASKMHGFDSQGFPDIDSWGEIRITVPKEFKPGDEVLIKYNIYRKRTNRKVESK